ncbi:flavin monoamine oxidase family protein [Fictibacillus phosphorivorans]|uniref:flavin monoamine oxidase family protein n=1 Tax=Fictibacillus phosphorivorans TaxID=1221500 RepID=UPI00203A9CD5|nr:flavin monoamine oxidase family protein [Fictibacillus phosphorivorans]MCM3717544.1 flavin monoamine oxidase family protein [Fictibacillus phosphorivorans]MCM3775239.1 flavin monoamine oxidase family protein [Fictibacillus phosphorivorans]
MNFSRLTDEEMVNTIRIGLNRTSSPQKIIIVGAGMAGLTAASLLQAAGHDVRILESSHRVGGRVYTIRAPFSHGHYFEAGAMRIPETHKLVMEYIKKFNLPTNEFINSNPHDIIYVNGIRTNQSMYEQNPDILRFPLAETEKGKTAEKLMQYAVQPLVNFIEQDPDKHWPIVIQNFQHYSLDNFLRHNPFGRSLSPGAIDKIKVLLSLEGLPELSFLEVFRDILIIFMKPDLKYVEITGGNDLLPRAFLKELRPHINFGQKLVRIVNDPNKVILYTENPKTLHRYKFEADRVIITIPFSVLNFVHIEPFTSLSYHKRKAIRELHYVPSTKVGIEFKHRFWEKSGLTGGKSVTDLSSRFTYYPNKNQQGFSSGIVLGSYTWEDDTVPWKSASNEMRIKETLHFLSYFHGKQVFHHFVTGHAHSWSIDPNAGGCFAFFKPYQESELFDAIKAPEGRLHFAGEHTTLNHGWIEGAIESAIRVAHEINS